jgi:hypothetical protein
MGLLFKVVAYTWVIVSLAKWLGVIKLIKKINKK